MSVSIFCTSCNHEVTQTTPMEALTQYGQLVEEGQQVDIDECRDCNAQAIAKKWIPGKPVIVHNVLYRIGQTATFMAGFTGNVQSVKDGVVTVILNSKRDNEPAPVVVAERFPQCMRMRKLSNGVHAVVFALPANSVYHPGVTLGIKCHAGCQEQCETHTIAAPKKVKV